MLPQSPSSPQLGEEFWKKSGVVPGQTGKTGMIDENQSVLHIPCEWESSGK
jgi:hypothetical protein